MIDYAAILTANYAGKSWVMAGETYDGLQWNDATPKPTQAELDAQWPQVNYDNQVTQIETTRRTQYEAKSDGLFFEWQRGTNTQEAWETAVQAIKDANPYPPEPTTSKKK
jgi:hypothetical protein